MNENESYNERYDESESYNERGATGESSSVIDLTVMAKKLWDGRRLFYKVLPITFLVASIYIMGLPRYYTSDARLAPEASVAAGGGLGSLASSFGFNIGGMPTTDAIYPDLYPDLMDDNGFVASLFNIKVVSQDGTINTTYHDYLRKHQKKSLWSYPSIWFKKLLPKKKKAGTGGGSELDPYNLPEPESNLAEVVRANVKFNFNEKTGVITIKTRAQDALVCKMLADSVKARLQDFITEYRTNKARIDYEYYRDLQASAKHEYERARQQYASMADANSNVALRSVELKLQDMENDMQLKFNAYTTINSQLEAAKAKVQERTPAFTLLKGAAVPIRPAGPKRGFFVLSMLLLATIATAVYILRKDLLKIIVLREK